MQIKKLPALSKQVGGSHYKNQNYELAQFSLDVGLNPMVHSAIKYILRDKNDKAEDLDKAVHCLEIYRDWLHQMIANNPKRLTSEYRDFSFNPVSTFVGQLEAYQQAAVLACIQMQSDLQIVETFSEHTWDNIPVICIQTIDDNYAKALEHIERMK